MEFNISLIYFIIIILAAAPAVRGAISSGSSIVEQQLEFLFLPRGTVPQALDVRPDELPEHLQLSCRNSEESKDRSTRIRFDCLRDR